jgi:cation transporter-like permease
MNKVLKWILYILLGLVVLAVIAGIVFAIFGGVGYGMMRPGNRMMEPYRYNISPVRSIFVGLLCLGVLLLVIVGIVALVTALMRGNRPAQTIPPAQMTTPSRNCSNCGKPVQEDWKTCPYCGNPLT